MRCKPEDLALVIRGPEVIAGRLVDVINLAPTGQSFRLPDGQKHQSVPAGYWICRIVGSPIEVPIGLFGKRVSARMASWLAAPDHALQPIRDQPGADETLTWRPLPAADQPCVLPATDAEWRRTHEEAYW